MPSMNSPTLRGTRLPYQALGRIPLSPHGVSDDLSVEEGVADDLSVEEEIQLDRNHMCSTSQIYSSSLDRKEA